MTEEPFTAARLLGGAVADGAIGDVRAIIGGCVGTGAGLGSVFVWLLDHEPRWAAGAGYGGIAGFVIGVLLAIVDFGLGQ